MSETKWCFFILRMKKPIFAIQLFLSAMCFNDPSIVSSFQRVASGANTNVNNYIDVKGCKKNKIVVTWGWICGSNLCEYFLSEGA
jgi:hypothetical protein